MKINVHSPKNKETVSIHTELQKEFLFYGGNKGKEASVDYLNLIKQREERTFPNPVTVSWDGEFFDDQTLFLHLSKESDFSEYKVYETEKNKAVIFNLEIGTEYFWRVCSTSRGEITDISDAFSFTVSDIPPRWIYAKGLGNIRDIGGWTGKNGKKIKQGMFFRGCEMEFHYTIEDEGRQVLAEDLGIKTDLDLRGEAVGKIDSSKIGGNCSLALIPCAAYADFMNDKETCKKIFSVLANAENYPVYMHCWGGADRTGTVAFLLSAILGVKLDDLFLDYEITSLSTWGERSSDSEQFKGFLHVLDEYGEENDTVGEKCESFILSSGITKQEIENIRKIFLG